MRRLRALTVSVVAASQAVVTLGVAVVTLGVAVVTLGVGVAGLAPALGAARGSAPAPRLVVFISVDQMRADYLERFRPLWSGGLKRLATRGAVFTNARYRHACTQTGPGHSVLLTGRSPRSSGIVHNDWYDRRLRRRVDVVADETTRLLGGSGHAASPARLEGFTVGDLLKERSPGSRVIGVSFKDRAAILMAGKRADAAYWFEDEGGRFVTSSHYMKETPRWLAEWNAAHRADAFASRPWERLLPDPRLYNRYAGADRVAGEDGGDNVFPHRLPGAPPEERYYKGLWRTPFADTMLLDFALAAMAAHHLGEDAETDLIAIGFSACDVIGHTYGPDSQEQMDNLLRLDQALGRLLDAVDARVGSGRAIVVLTADHGVMPLVESLQARGLPGRRFGEDELLKPVAKAVAARFPGTGSLIADAYPLEYVLDDEAIARRGLRRADVEQTIRKALLETGAVAGVYSSVELLGEPPAGDPYFPMYERAFFASRSGDLIARPKEYAYISKYVGGTGHGTPYDYDRHVPIVFLGPGVTPGARDVACGPEDIAWTLGRLLGLDYPKQDAETDLLPLLR